jgi:hypothetical protein
MFIAVYRHNQTPRPFLKPHSDLGVSLEDPIHSCKIDLEKQLYSNNLQNRLDSQTTNGTVLVTNGYRSLTALFQQRVPRNIGQNFVWHPSKI